MADWLLYEHDDGRHAVAPSADAATFARDDPTWHRVGPVEVALPADYATFREGNWSHPDRDGSRIVGWRIPAADVARMGADAFCLPREVGECLAKLAAPQGYRAVPIENLVRIARLIDPAPVEVDGKTMVFSNPAAADVLRLLSAEIRELLAHRATDSVTGGQK